MNPAFSIRARAIGLSACVSLIASFTAPFIRFVLLLVAIGTLVSLVCFYLLFEPLRLLQIGKLPFRLNTIITVPAIVAFNAWCFPAAFAGDKENVWSLFLGFLPVALIPVMGAIIGTSISHKQINTFCTHDSKAYYPDSFV